MARTGSRKANPQVVPRDKWETPWRIVNEIAKITGCPKYDLDACADKTNRKGAVHFDQRSNGLKRSWFGNVWCNPPYGRQIHEWIHKAVLEVSEQERGQCQSVAMLLPANNTDRIMWHTHILPLADWVIMFKGRIAFEYKGIPANGSDISSCAVGFSREGYRRRSALTFKTPRHLEVFSVSAKVGIQVNKK